MVHPKYKIIQITENKNNITEETVSKQLMFKCDAERIVNYQNQYWGINKPDYKLYWIIKEYTKGN